MAEMIFAGADVRTFGAAGDGVADDAAAIAKALAGAEEVLFPGGTYAIKSNLVLPAGKRILFADGAKLNAAAGITVTVNSGIHAGLYPVFTGPGRYVTALPNRTVYPQWFGANGLTGTGGRGIVASGSMDTGSNILTLNSGAERFEDGQTVIVMHAGRPLTLAAPQAPAISLTTLWNGTVTTGSTTYGYRIVELHPDGAVSLPSPVAQITNGPDRPEAFEYWMGTRVTLKMPAASTFAQGWAVYGEPTNPEGHRGLLAVQWKRQPEWHDVRNGPIDRSVGPWIPLALPTAPRSNNLIATIVSGGGTQKLTLSAPAQSTVASVAIMANDAPALQRAYDYLESGGGGLLELQQGRFYMHSPTGGDVKSAVFFPSNVVTQSRDRSILQTYPNFLVDGQVTMSGKGGNVHNWGFEGVVFDGGNEVNTTEFFNWILGTMPNSAQSASSYTHFFIRGCEFRFILGKGLVTGLGNCENYWIQDNYIHHCNSNAMSVGGRRYYVDRNLCEYCLAATPAYIGGAESIILTESFQAQITNNIIRRWGNISAGNAFRYEEIEVSGNRFEDQNGIGFGGLCRNIRITGNMIVLNNTNHISGNGINWELTQGTGRYAYDIVISGNVIDCTGNVGAIALNVSTANTLSRLTITDNTIRHRNTAFETVMIQNATSVIFANNQITAESTANDVAVITTGGSSWTISGNRVPGKNIQVPERSFCTGNLAGGLRVTGSCVVTGNKLDGVQGANTWGGLLNLAGSMNTVSNNEIDMASATLPLAIAENASSTGNIITGNLIKNYSPRDPRTLILHTFGSTVIHNTPYNTRTIELDRVPEQGIWTAGDRVMNNRPTPANLYDGWICTVGGTAARQTWLPGTAYETNSLVLSNGKVYRASAVSGDGRTGSAAPSHISGTVTDGGITWQFVDIAAVFKPFGAIVFGTVDQTPPATPQGLTATAGSRQVTLNWTAASEPDIAGYYIYQNGRRISNPPVRSIPYTVTGLVNGTVYSFQVSAVDTVGNESLRTVTVNATPRDTTAPAAPTGLTGAGGVSQVALSWTANTDSDLAGYNVYRNGAKVNGSLVKGTNYTDTGLTNGTSYTYRLTAVDLDGNESAPSAAVIATPGEAQTVIVADTFNRAAQTGLGQAETGQTWIPLLGQMRIRNNMAESGAAGPNASVVETGKSDCTIVGSVLSKGNPVWLVFRAKDSQNHMVVSLRKDGYSTLEKVENGNRSILGIALPGAVYTDGAEIKILLKGSRIDLYYNNNLLRTFTDTFNLSETKHGIGGSYTDTYVDRFSVTG